MSDRAKRRSLRARIDSAVQAAEFGSWMAREWLTTPIVYNPLRKGLFEDPFPFYRKLRERDPIHRSHLADGYVLTRYDDIFEVMRDGRFSSDERNWTRYRKFRARSARKGLPDPYDEERATMLRVDAPDHTRLRGLANKAFTPRAVEALRPRIVSLVDELLAGVADRGRMELVTDFASPLPVIIIAELLGVPPEDHQRFRHWSDEAIKTLGVNTEEDAYAADRAFAELRTYLEEIVEQRRIEPRDDLVSRLVAAEEEGDRLSVNELLSTCVLLLVAGNETTTKLIGNAVVALLRNPGQLELLRDEPKRIAGAVDELLRYDGPVQLTSRIALEDGELRGHAYRKGQQFVLILAAANRDPEAFEDPDRLDVSRENVRHLAFGHGTHFCLGAQLARLETALALEGLLTRFPNLQMLDDQLEWSRNTILRGPLAVPLEI